MPVSVDLVWRAWTQAEHLKPWFCPRPWRVADCELNVTPGGIFRFTLEGPNGEKGEHLACYLEVVCEKRLVWTTALKPGFVPAPVSKGVPDFTAFIELEVLGPKRTRYRATAAHRDESGAATHERMGFHQGWGTTVDQLVELLTT